MQAERDVVILGSSISAWMAAAWLKTWQPELSITVVGPPTGHERRPIVGESLVEPAILFFRELGLGPYLDGRHEMKYGLSFYHKLAPGDPGDRRYTVHAPMEKLHHQSRQLHRPAFDQALGRLAIERGVEHWEGIVTEVVPGRGGSRHEVRAQGLSLSARWIIDATGRKRILGKQVTRYSRPPEEGQRSAFWFRIRKFEPLLPRLELSFRRPTDYPLWLTTNHFMGRGNWIWCIPLKDDDGSELLSVGITWRPDVFPTEIRNMEDFLRWVDSEHPAIGEMVRSGEIVDTQRYRSYLYRAEQVYSEDGWFLIGDAARSVDPLYSTGLSMTAVQVEQVAEIIRRQRAGSGPEGIDAAGIDALQQLWLTLAGIRQDDITDQYKTMNDPFQACMRRYWNLCAWFNGFLPLWYNGCFSDPQAARVLQKLFASGIPGSRSAWKLIGAASAALGDGLEQKDFDRTLDFDWLINRPFDCPPAELPVQLGRLGWKRLRMRWNLLSFAGFRHLPSQLRPMLRELVSVAFCRLLLFRLPALRGSRRQRSLPSHSGESLDPPLLLKTG